MPYRQKDRIILHVDMDSFYASVEMRENPKLKGKPVIIGADPKSGTGRGVVSTCSYEARKFGVRSAMPVTKAYMLCPDGIFLPVNMRLYALVSENVMNILREYSDKFQQVSVDEAYLDVTYLGNFYNASNLAKEIKDKIRNTENITCSVGVAPSKVVAKIASDFQKPNGLTVVTPDKVRDFLNPMDVGKIPGIGKKTQSRLSGLGIFKISDLADYDIQKLISVFGKHAVDMQKLATGKDEREVREKGERKSIGRERTYPEDTADEERITKTIEWICEDIHKRLIEKDFRFRTVTVKIRYTGFITKTRAVTLDHCTDSPDIIKDLAIKIFRNLIDTDKKPVRLIGVSISGFESGRSRQTRIEEFFR
ncbi:DNA polymerase IV [Methanoplanus sp. FWC-SCC4]|uniref:DNA polymerase IV n=1 Tax=Methanochimaera problematica TaxID=2609417 RepID=A0AA97FBV0_9EURY|nr:DNA polymerase IV [Methanoplanus sp. FWC-SCC4]WOF16585.1 DNA polymerase IV [Methanoplanus sp. FWC-SCC4]